MDEPTVTVCADPEHPTDRTEFLRAVARVLIEADRRREMKARTERPEAHAHDRERTTG